MAEINNLLEHLVALVGHVAWPVTVFFIAYFARDQVKDVISAISSRIRDPSSNIAIGKEGLEIKAQLEAKLESLEIDQEQVKSLALKALNVPDKPIEGSDSNIEIDKELLALSEQYNQIKIKDWGERVRAKDAAAREMADLVITKGISRSALAGQHHDGLILALAATIHALPQQSDVEHILRVADEAQTLHVKYRIVLAISKLIDRHLVNNVDINRIKNVLSLYKQTADGPLMRRIEHTESQLAKYESTNSA